MISVSDVSQASQTQLYFFYPNDAFRQAVRFQLLIKTTLFSQTQNKGTSSKKGISSCQKMMSQWSSHYFSSEWCSCMFLWWIYIKHHSEHHLCFVIKQSTRLQSLNVNDWVDFQLLTSYILNGCSCWNKHDLSHCSGETTFKIKDVRCIEMKVHSDYIPKVAIPFIWISVQYYFTECLISFGFSHFQSWKCHLWFQKWLTVLHAPITWPSIFQRRSYNPLRWRQMMVWSSSRKPICCQRWSQFEPEKPLLLGSRDVNEVLQNRMQPVPKAACIKDQSEILKRSHCVPDNSFLCGCVDF